MEDNTSLFWFGFLIEFVFILAIVKLVDLGSEGSDKIAAERNRLRRDYQRLQQELQQKAALTEDLRLQQELQRHKEQITQEYDQLQQALPPQDHPASEPAQLQQALQQQKDQLTQTYSRLQQELTQQNEQLVQECSDLRRSLQQQQTAPPQDHLTSEPVQLQQALQQQKDQLTQIHSRLQQELTQQNEQLVQECSDLRRSLQQQEATLTTALRQSTFKQLQTLFTNYPSVSKIAQAKPDLPAKNLTPMFAPLDHLMQTWGYEPIGAVWEQVAYDPNLHQPDAPDIEPGDRVYVRFVGYRDGDTVLCPAKVSRTLTKAIGT